MRQLSGIVALFVLAAMAGCQWAPRAPRSGESAVTRTVRELPHADPDVHPAAYWQEPEHLQPPADVSQEPLPAIDRVAQPDGRLSLADLEGIALAYHPALAAAAARVDAAQGKHLQAGLLPNPVIGYHGTEIGNLETAGQQGGFINQHIITGHKLQLDQAMASKTIEEASYQLQAQQQRVLNDVRLRFYDSLVAQRRLELTRELARLGDELVGATRMLLTGGLVPETDLLQAETEADRAQILHDNAGNGQREAWRRLTAVSGIPDLPIAPLEGRLEGDLPELDWEETRAMLMAASPELSAAKARAERAEIAIRRAQREPFPNVDVSISVRRHNLTRSNVANVQAGIPLPLFDRNEGEIRAAEAQWMAASQEVRRIELDLQDRLAVAFRQYTNALQQSQRYGRRMLPRTQKSLELVRDGFEKGQVEYPTLLTAQQTHLEVSLSYLDSLRELRTAAAVIEGQLLSDSLANRP